MDSTGRTIESQPEPKPIRRLQDEVINRIAAGEVSQVLHFGSPLPVYALSARSDAMLGFLSFFFLRSYIVRLLLSKNCLKTVWMRVLLLFVSPLETGV